MHGGALELHALRRLPPSVVRRRTTSSVLPSRKRMHLLDDLVVLLLACSRRCRARCSVDVVVEAGARVVAGDLLRAGAPGEELLDEVQRAPHGAGAGVGPEVAGAVLLDAARDVDARPGVLDVDLQVRIVLVVLEADVEERLVALDQRRFEDAAPRRRCRRRCTRSRRSARRGRASSAPSVRRAEVGAHAVLELRRLADVDHLAFALRMM